VYATADMVSLRSWVPRRFQDQAGLWVHADRDRLESRDGPFLS